MNQILYLYLFVAARGGGESGDSAVDSNRFVVAGAVLSGSGDACGGGGGMSRMVVRGDFAAFKDEFAHHD